jgi:hypothetical protein
MQRLARKVFTSNQREHGINVNTYAYDQRLVGSQNIAAVTAAEQQHYTALQNETAARLSHAQNNIAPSYSTLAAATTAASDLASNWQSIEASYANIHAAYDKNTPPYGSHVSLANSIIANGGWTP